MASVFGIGAVGLAVTVVVLALRLVKARDKIADLRILAQAERTARDGSEEALHSVSNELHTVRKRWEQSSKLWEEERNRLLTELAKAHVPDSVRRRIVDVSGGGGV